MPYKNLEKQKEAQRQYYLNNKNKAKENVRRRRKEYITWFEEIKSSLKCIKCRNNHPAVLDFHHRSKSEKIIAVSQLLWKNRIEELMIEIKKCDVLCANCHRKLHHYGEVTNEKIFTS